jgi:hypothetical protein
LVSKLLRTWAKVSKTLKKATGRKEDAGVVRSGAVHGDVEVEVEAMVNGRLTDVRSSRSQMKLLEVQVKLSSSKLR